MKKLKSKHTGVIGELLITDKHYTVNYEDDASHTAISIYTSLDSLNEDWEDYDETETYFINADGGISINALADKKARENSYKQLKAVGNYFETREEAEQAVEKLKAWKRLKDKGFKFKDFGRLNDCAFFIRATSNESWFELYDDLDLLFGGDE